MQETGSNNSQRKLSIRFSAGGFSFCINGKEKVVNFESADSSFLRSEAVCLCEGDIWEDYNTVDIEIDDSVSALVPASVFGNSDCNKFLSFNNPKTDLSGSVTRTDYIEGFDIANVYAVDKNLDCFISEYFPYARIKHYSTTLISKLLRHTKQSGTKEVWASAMGNTMYIAVADNGNLLMSNRFDITGETDFVYYIGSVYTQFSLSQFTTPLYINNGCKYSDAISKRVANCNQF